MSFLPVLSGGSLNNTKREYNTSQTSQLSAGQIQHDTLDRYFHTVSSTPPALIIYFSVLFHNTCFAFGTTLWHFSVLTSFFFFHCCCSTGATVLHMTKPSLTQEMLWLRSICCKYGHLAVNIIYRAYSSIFYVISRPYANHTLCA